MAKHKREISEANHNVIDIRDDSQNSITAFSGPLPPPNILAEYEQILPGTADRLIRVAEKQSEHRQELEHAVIHSNIKNENISMWLAFFLTISLMGLGFYLILNDKSIAGYFAVFGPVVFHAGNYLYNKKREVEIAKG